MTSRDLTRDGMVRALSAALARSAGVDAALAGRAAGIAARAEGRGLDARIVPQGAGGHAVEISGPGLFARAFGSREAPGDGTLASLLDDGEAP